jgi:site-specific recombinase XerC
MRFWRRPTREPGPGVAITLCCWLLQTGTRLSEVIGLRRQDVSLGAGAHVHVVGKGRKERCMPLTKEPVRGNSEILFPNPRWGD